MKKGAARERAEIESIDNGKSAVIAKVVDVGLTVSFLRYMAGWATKVEGSTVDVSVPFAPGGLALRRQRHAGCCGQ